MSGYVNITVQLDISGKYAKIINSYITSDFNSFRAIETCKPTDQYILTNCFKAEVT